MRACFPPLSPSSFHLFFLSLFFLSPSLFFPFSLYSSVRFYLCMCIYIAYVNTNEKHFKIERACAFLFSRTFIRIGMIISSPSPLVSTALVFIPLCFMYVRSYEWASERAIEIILEYLNIRASWLGELYLAFLYVWHVYRNIELKNR